jgi:hypothetical protein
MPEYQVHVKARGVRFRNPPDELEIVEDLVDADPVLLDPILSADTRAADVGVTTYVDCPTPAGADRLAAERFRRAIAGAGLRVDTVEAVLID